MSRGAGGQGLTDPGKLRAAAQGKPGASPRWLELGGRDSPLSHHGAILGLGSHFLACLWPVPSLQWSKLLMI